METDPAHTVRTSVLLGGAGVDGGLDGPGEPASTWREATGLGRVEPTGLGARFLEDPAPLIDLAGGLGVDEVLLRVQWARLEPAEGHYDEGEVARIARVVDMLRAQDLGVGLVLTDGTLPAWLGPEGWLLPATPGRLRALGSMLCHALAPLDLLVALEEPASFALAGWCLGVAPPWWRAAVRDAAAALDGMLVGAAMLATDVDVDVTFLSSPGALGALEATVVGQPVPPVPPTMASLVARLAATTPGRAMREGTAAMRWPLAPVGDRLPVALGTLGMVQRWCQGSTTAAHLLGISSGVSLRTIAAQVDAKGRVSRLDGHHRPARLSSLLGEVDAAARVGGPCRRVVVGELVDRWRWGTFRSREGLVAVDRLRGPTGAEVLGVDAAGLDAVAAVRAALAGR